MSEWADPVEISSRAPSDAAANSVTSGAPTPPKRRVRSRPGSVVTAGSRVSGLLRIATCTAIRSTWTSHSRCMRATSSE
jgi:hypothetical protein